MQDFVRRKIILERIFHDRISLWFTPSPSYAFTYSRNFSASKRCRSKTTRAQVITFSSILSTGTVFCNFGLPAGGIELKNNFFFRRLDGSCNFESISVTTQKHVHRWSWRHNDDGNIPSLPLSFLSYIIDIYKYRILLISHRQIEQEICYKKCLF